MRIGLGIDIHRLIPDSVRPLMLGGVAIPSDLALEGHSDADCILHALTDAILGALGKGDIGEAFPNTDPRWKNADSATFITHAVREMRVAGYTIGNVDVVVLAEVPKLSPHREAIRARLAELLDTDPTRISLKATTMEGLGAIGRHEGILAQAVVLLVLADEEKSGPGLSLAAKRKVIAEDLASRPAPDEPPVKSRAKKPSKGPVLKAWTDGASRGNPGPASIGVVVKNEAGGIIHQAKQCIGNATNNVAEYRAMIYALRIAAPLSPSRLEIYADSELIVKQMRGEYRVKDEALQKLYFEAQGALRDLGEVTFTHVRREFNQEADALANEALDEQ